MTGWAFFEGLAVGEHTATYDARPLVPLTRLDVALLRELAHAAGQPVSRAQLLTQCWGGDDGRPQKVDVAISRLREKLAWTRVSIQVVRGVGYRLGVRREQRVSSGTFARAGGSSLLVVDDDAHVRRSLVRCLSSACDVRNAPSIAEALALVPTAEWFGAIIELRLTDGPGLGLVPHLRRQSPGVDILVLSGSTDREVVNQAVRLGVRYAVKPVDPELLLSFVDDAQLRPASVVGGAGRRGVR